MYGVVVEVVEQRGAACRSLRASVRLAVLFDLQPVLAQAEHGRPVSELDLVLDIETGRLLRFRSAVVEFDCVGRNQSGRRVQIKP